MVLDLGAIVLPGRWRYLALASSFSPSRSAIGLSSFSVTALLLPKVSISPFSYKETHRPFPHDLIHMPKRFIPISSSATLGRHSTGSHTYAVEKVSFSAVVSLTQCFAIGK